MAAERLADHVVISRSKHIPRVQEAQASAYHALRVLVPRLPPPNDGGIAFGQAAVAARTVTACSG